LEGGNEDGDKGEEKDQNFWSDDVNCSLIGTSEQTTTGTAEN